MKIIKRIFVLGIAIFIFIAMGEFISPMKAITGNQSKINTKKKTVVSKKIASSQSTTTPYNKDQWAIEFTQSSKAWKLVKQKREVWVAVVDSGVDYNHPDLKNRVLKDKGYNFISNNKNVMDNMGHGTEVAGIIAAEGRDGQGVTGIAGPLDVKIIPIKVLDKDGKGPSDVVANGIIYAANEGADIINVSIDFNNHDQYIINAVNYAVSMGSMVVVASGNSNSSCDLYSPAGDKGAYTVSAITPSYERPYFSSYGSSVSIAAPGVDILTTIPGGKYDEASGTSMSTPIVSGIAAMVKAEDPALSPNDIAKILDVTAKDVQAKGKDKQSGYGLINAYGAVNMVKELEIRNNSIAFYKQIAGTVWK